MTSAGELRVFFSEAYAPPSQPMLQRLGLAARLIERRGLGRLQAPRAIERAALDGLHCEHYLRAFLDGVDPLASSQGLPWSAALRDSALAMLGGQLEGAQQALRCGVAMNLARGFHHAVHARGSGFCALNGLALIAHALPQQRIAVLDCDEHGGNGTEEFAARLGNLHAVSIFGTRFGCYGGLRSSAFPVRVREQGFGKYLDALNQAMEIVAGCRPDLLVYQAGADCHRDDPKNQAGLSTRELFQRDLFVFEAAHRLQLPVLFLVGGGYQRARRVAQLNLNTVVAARTALGMDRGAAG
ncbi:hypothetical protein [Tahibacter caeni]|uniref:hypothetical protein n=1 Tax=Tahibacter caeni TaxID=1453545 RepID=UPI0021480C9F|nr:hypothetical protein [Tahibacter caeni]